MCRFLLMSVLAAGVIAGCEQSKEPAKPSTPTTTMTDKAKEATKEAVDKTKEATKEAVDKTKEAAKEAGDKAAASFAAMRDKAASEIQTSLDALKPKLDALKTKVDAQAEPAKSLMQKSYQSVADTFKGLQDKTASLKTAGADTWEKLSKEIKDAIPALDKAVTDLTSKLGGK